MTSTIATQTTETIWFLDALAHVHVDADQTDGTHAVIEFLLPPGHMPPPHVHLHDAESFFVLEGEITVHTEAGATVLATGQAAHAPAGEPHTFEVTSPSPARVLVVAAPAGFLGFVRACGRPADREELPVMDGPPDLDLLVRAAAEHGIVFVGPPGTRPADLVAGA